MKFPNYHLKQLFLISTFITTIVATASKVILSLTDASTPMFKESVSLKNTEWLILFYADWCGACKMYKPLFHQLASDIEHDDGASFKLATVNYSDSPLLALQFGLSVLPTVYHVKNGEFRDVTNHRSQLSKDFFANNEWQSIKPVSPWTAPFSAFGNAMVTIGYFGFLLVKGVGKLQEMSRLQAAITISLFIFGIALLFLFLTWAEKFLLKAKAKQDQKDQKEKWKAKAKTN